MHLHILDTRRWSVNFSNITYFIDVRSLGQCAGSEANMKVSIDFLSSNFPNCKLKHRRTLSYYLYFMNLRSQ